MRSGLLLLVTTALLVSGSPGFAEDDTAPRAPDVLVVGAGISGLSATLELARGGARVTVVDMWSMYGGHAVMSSGGLCIVDTPFQRSKGVKDSPELAEKDFLSWGRDADPGWVRYYVESSRSQIYDWLETMGVGYSAVYKVAGNSVARFHEVEGRGLGLVTPVYRACLRMPNVDFRWNFKVTDLLEDGGRVSGVRGIFLREGRTEELRASHVILATGGFQSNLQMVREYWPKSLPFPDTLLIGSGVNSVGSGHEVARSAGATLARMDRQWNYAAGLPDPLHPGEGRGLNSRNPASIWVNAQAKRFVNETSSTRERFPALLRQDPPMYWMIFDEEGKKWFRVSGSGWDDPARIEGLIFSNPDLVHSAESVEDLAREIGLDPIALRATIDGYNHMIDTGRDEDYGRFDTSNPPEDPLSRSSSSLGKINEPPLYAIQHFPLTRKSMGGVHIDHSTRVLDKGGQPIPGLYAVGELTGFGGINGWAGLEGTFLGPSIVTGRVAGRTILGSLPERTAPSPREAPTMPPEEAVAVDQCMACHDLPTLVAEERPGYSHFQSVHQAVLAEGLDCGRCHAELSPFDPETHRISRAAQTNNCRFCHVAQE